MFLIIFRLILLSMGNISDKIFGENQNTCFIFWRFANRASQYIYLGY